MQRCPIELSTMMEMPQKSLSIYHFLFIPVKFFHYMRYFIKFSTLGKQLFFMSFH